MLRSALLVCLILFSAVGCTPKMRETPKAEPPVTPVSKPAMREVQDFVEFTGRTNAVESVNVVPRVTGYLTKITFKEGAEVKTGDLLFEIDPRPYQAQLDQALGQVSLYQSQLQLARTTLARDRDARGAVSALQIDQAIAAVDEAQARVRAFQASTEVYKLNLDFTKVKAPIDGQVGRRYLTVGNLVSQDQTLLTTVVSLDPMHVYFDMDETTLQSIRQAINQGRVKVPADGKIPVNMSLPGEANYPRKGVIDFVNNQVNPNTGSIAVRGVFANPKPENGVRLMAPGMFVRIQLPIGDRHPAMLVIDRAITSDQGLKYVNFLDAENKIQSREVKIGALQEDGLRVITSGLKGDEWVVVGGLQQIRPGVVVSPEKLEDMPSYRQRIVEKEPKEKAAKSSGRK
ncbi:MAG: efflux RND transporter periplasmic adaptor subunit [Gemmataceae bacterium]|nr:efflux RND transporter periplasmic adaptor subunit [Gemmataceae bacterium]